MTPSRPRGPRAYLLSAKGPRPEPPQYIHLACIIVEDSRYLLIITVVVRSKYS